MFNADRYMITIAEVKQFSSEAASIFTVEEVDLLTDFLASSPVYGEVIPDAGGIRIMEWPAERLGYGEHVRVVYYFHDLNMPVYLIAIYTKTEPFLLSSDDLREIRRLVDEIVASHGERCAARIAVNEGAA